MAKKPKLTRQQKLRVAQNRKKRLSNDASNLDDAIKGRVVGRFGKQANVETDNGLMRCHIRRTIDSVVCGDSVLVSRENDSDAKIQGIIELVHDRVNVLSRPDFYDGVKPVAANVDQIIVVSSVLPEFSPHIIDRYLVACEDIGISPILLVNKFELANEEEQHSIKTTMESYQSLGYHVVMTSCKTKEGLNALTELLDNQTSIFVGQSGVGKSSLINQVLPNADELVGDISDNSGLGQHTTTASKLLSLPSGGELIDSPGVREFGLWHLPEEKVTWGFREFRDLVGGCKFRDCKHLNDPGCIIRAAVEKGEISQQRFDSYHRIITSMSEQKPSYL
ncbi:small ribosomal subunit biogenesis GTPase RsgA [Alteromonas sp. 5E99-2]|uniref:small ribosomal subunit biogenesis GTPase RsgA n=1 Tax=Alteromonas sp. 5E99-2 TaxID=2817683 RepID=UPI001A9A21E9|nr:small ribosomal subunit biogenesis GTPase RsgA [Alteromonas sp. 5E99-2]